MAKNFDDFVKRCDQSENLDRRFDKAYKSAMMMASNAETDRDKLKVRALVLQDLIIDYIHEYHDWVNEPS